MNYFEAWSQESHGGRYSSGIKILLAFSSGREAKDLTEDERMTLIQAAGAIEEAGIAAYNKSDPARIEANQKERAGLLGLFTEPIFVEEIPNGYCSKACCRDRPWFIITTKVGYIKIGWRKRVIEISWDGPSLIKKTAREMFPDEDVTKDDKLIHAWSLDHARRYIKVLEAQA